MKKRFYKAFVAFLLMVFMVASVSLPAFAESEGAGPAGAPGSSGSDGMTGGGGNDGSGGDGGLPPGGGNDSGGGNGGLPPGGGNDSGGGNGGLPPGGGNDGSGGDGGLPPGGGNGAGNDGSGGDDGLSPGGGNGGGDGGSGAGGGLAGNGDDGSGGNDGLAGDGGEGPGGLSATGIDAEDAMANASRLLQEKKSSGVKLTTSMKNVKAEMAGMRLGKTLADLRSDKDYVNHEIIYPTNSGAEAKLIAQAYDGIVTSVSEGIAVIKLAANTIDAIEKAEDLSNDFPAAFPNIIYTLDEGSDAASGKGADGSSSPGTAPGESGAPDAAGESGTQGSESGETGAQGSESDESGAPGAQGSESGATGAQGSDGGAGPDPAGAPEGEGGSDAPDANAPDAQEPEFDVVLTLAPEDVVTVFEQGRIDQDDIDAMDALMAPDLLSEDDLLGLSVAPFASAPNDPYANLQWHHARIGTYDAWKYSKGKDVKVAVIDTGIDTTHPDLKNNIIGAFSTTSFAYNGNTDNYGHGTHAAGIIAAQAGNKIGVAGIAPQAKIISIKALDYYWSSDAVPVLKVGGSTAEITRAVNMAVSKGAQVINLSLGGETYDAPFEQAVAKAGNKGIVVVASAGNLSLNLATSPYYPAKYDVICVSAVSKEDTLAYYSNYGAGWITVAAPGGSDPLNNNKPLRIASTHKAKGYAWMQGTSMAAPMVSGVAALLIAQNPAYKKGKNKDAVNYIIDVLTSSASTPIGGANHVNFGAGIVSASGATAMLAAPIYAPWFENTGGQILKSGQTITTTNAGATTNIIIGSDNATSTIYRYTTNGKNPTLASAGGNQIPINANGKKTITLKAAACIDGKLSKVTTATYKLDAKINSIALTPKSGAYDPGAPAVAAVGLGKKLTLTVTTTPAKPLNKKMVWTTSDKTIAAVDSNGVVTAKSIGTATITATNAHSGVSRSINVKVYPLTKSISVSVPTKVLATTACMINGVAAPTSTNLTVGQDPAGAYPVGALTGAKNFSYKSSKPKVASVDENGVIRAVSSGSAKITVTARDGSGKSETLTVTVIKPAQITSVTCKEGQPTGTSYVVGLGKTINLTAVLADNKATDNNLVWASNNTAVATVSGGKVKGVTPGNTTITVKTRDGISTGAAGLRTITITVKPATAGLTASSAKATLKMLGAPSLGWTVTNITGGAHNTQYVYTVKDNTVATVTGSGANVTIYALKKGTTTVTAKAVDGSGKTVKIAITVQRMVDRIVLSYPSTKGIAYGKSMKFGATVYPSDASNKKLIWEVENAAYFKVNSSGKVTMTKKAPKKDQSTKIKVRPADNPSASALYVSNIYDAMAGYGSTSAASAYEIRGYNDPLHGIFFSNTSNPLTQYKTITMDEGQTNNKITLRVYRASNDADDYTTVSVSSSNTKVAQYIYVSGAWQLKANNAGTATITVKTMDGSNKSAKLKVTVKRAAAEKL